MIYIFRLLQWFCPDHLYEEIEGDLIQQFNKDLQFKVPTTSKVSDTYRLRRAKRRLIWNAIRFLRPGIVFRNKFSVESNTMIMTLNYFKLAVRHLLGNKAFSLINLTGLTVGIVAYFVIVLYADFETSFDQFHSNREEIYRIALKRYEHGELVNATAKSYAGIYDLLYKNFPELKAASRIMKIPANTGALFKYKNKIYNEKGGIINVDTSFFKVFPSLLLRGDAATVLAKPNSIVISESVAKKVFGDTDPIGQQIEQSEEKVLNTVTGVIREIPGNSHFHARFVGRLREAWPDIKDWGSTLPFNYIALSPGADVASVTEKLNKLMNGVANQFPDTKGTTLFLQPIEDIHLKSQLKDEYELNGDDVLVYAMLAVGIIIMVIAWINYVNIEIARFLKRSKEVGVRRIIGSDKIGIALQFLIEYFCLGFASFIMAIVVFVFISPQLSDYTGIVMQQVQWPASPVMLKAILFFVVGSLIVGIYPVFFLLKLNPIASLKGNLGGTNRGKGVRRSLMAIQFSASLFLIAFVFIVNNQLDFMQSTNKKVDVDQVITLLNPTAYMEGDVKAKHSNFKLLENKLLQNHSVQMVSSSSAIPGAEIGFTFVNLIKQKKNDPYDPTRYKTLFVGENFIPLYGLKLLAGRNFDITNEEWAEPWQRRDWKKIILNEKAIRQLGFSSPSKAVNQVIQFHLWNDDFEDYEIIGVIEDYHHEAVKEEVFPMILSITYNSFQQVYYSVRLMKNSSPREALAYVEESWKEIFPDQPFEYFFLDDYYDRQFKSELQFKRIFTLFTSVALLLSCLGVLGISLFEVNIRLKEISIRKVLGASVNNLIALLSRDNIRIIAFSFFTACPFIYYLGDKWLSGYPLHININYLFFFIPVVILSFVISFTSSFQIIKAANSNPVNHLKNE
jgi:putative ABC transport system permease protein